MRMMNRLYYFQFIVFSFFLLNFSQVFSQNRDKTCKTRIAEIINSYQPTIIPVLTIDGTELFFDRKIHPQNTNGIKDKDEIWYSVKGTGNNWGEPINIGKPINTFDSDVLFSISPDGNKYLVYGLYGADGKSKSPGFSLTRKVFGKWDNPVPLNIKNYYNDSSNFYANLSADGRVLLMALHRKDSRGNLDLYFSFLTDSCCTFSEPVNLGDVINTTEIEIGRAHV